MSFMRVNKGKKDTTKLKKDYLIIEKSEQRIEKDKLFIKSKLDILNKKGLMLNFKDEFKKYLNNSENDYLEYYNDFLNSFKNEFDKLLSQGKVKDKDFDMIITVCNRAMSVVEHTIKIRNATNRIEKIEGKNPNVKEDLKQVEINKKEREMSKKEDDKRKEKIKQLNKAVSVDEWLSHYKQNLIKHYQMRLSKGYIEKWEYNQQMQGIDKYVDNQKDNLLERAYDVVGVVKSIEFGRIGADGSINGLVVGEKGRASVNTVLAGGLKQRLHYRIYVKKNKLKECVDE